MNNSPTIQPKARNYGIDLFKIFSMFMVVAIHTMNTVVAGSARGSVNGYTSKFMEILCISAVNCFALASGYILINVKYKFHKIISMYFQVWFYSVAITLLFFILFPGTYSLGTILHSVLPFTAGRYWYFSAYFGLYLLIPFINIMLNSLTKKQHFTLSIILFVLFSFLPVIAFHYGVLSTQNGFSFLWLAIIYIWGAYFGKYKLQLKKSTSFILFFACSILTFADCFNFFSSDIPVVSKIAALIQLERYDSPTVVLAAIALLALFSNIEVSNNNVIKIIKFIAPLNFGIYLIHNNQLMKNDVVLKYLPEIGKLATPKMILFSVLAMLFIWFVCITIEWGRFHLFKLLKIETLSQKMSFFLASIVNKIFSKYNYKHTSNYKNDF